MAGQPESDSSLLVSLLIEHSHGTYEVILRRIDIQSKPAVVPVQLVPVSGSGHRIPTHSCLGNAMSMQKWMDEHLNVFVEGLTSYG